MGVFENTEGDRCTVFYIRRYLFGNVWVEAVDVTAYRQGDSFICYNMNSYKSGDFS